jgi:hypothetical protein
MIKDGIEDMRRYFSDREVYYYYFFIILLTNYNIKANSKPAERLNYETAGFERIRSRDIRVGDIVKIAADEAVPADVVVMHSPSTVALATANLGPFFFLFYFFFFFFFLLFLRYWG